MEETKKVVLAQISVCDIIVFGILSNYKGGLIIRLPLNVENAALIKEQLAVKELTREEMCGG